MKTFLSIGTGPGIGFATAERFANEGFKVVLTARSIERTKELADRLTAQGHDVAVRAVDAGDADALAALIADVEAQIGPIDVLHYNAAILRQATIADQPADTFNADLAVNVGGALLATQACLRNMASRQSGSILLTGGFFAITPNPDYLSLSVGKAGIRALAQGLFEPGKALGVHVASVTVATYVTPDSPEAEGIADAFWRLHSQPKEHWAAEIIYPEPAAA